MADLHYERIQIVENNEPLVDLAQYPFLCDPAYYRMGLGDTPKMYARRAVAEKLVELQNGILTGYQFKIWDPWRSRNVQRNVYSKFWNEMKNDHPDWGEAKLRHEVAVYVVAPDQPGRIPPHSTGGAIDLTLADKATGHELDMGTGFDHFGLEAHPDYFENSENHLIRDNRRLLRNAMLKIGFTQDPDEWWHYDYGNQKWAEAAGKDEVLYGEITEPR